MSAGSDERADIVAREQILSVLVRCCRALDRADAELLTTVYHPDAVEIHGDYTGSAEGFRARAIRNVQERFEVMRHSLGTVVIDIDGDHAHAESYFVASCVLRERSEGQRMLSELHGRYLDRFECRGAEWRIAKRVVVKDFRDVRPIADPVERYPLAQWGREDPSYHWD